MIGREREMVVMSAVDWQGAVGETDDCTTQTHLLGTANRIRPQRPARNWPVLDGALV